MNQLLILFERMAQDRSELHINNFVEACYRAYYQRTVRFAYSIGAAYPQDIAQELFRKFHQSLVNGKALHFPSEAAIRNYLFSAVKNLCYSEYHQRKRTIPLEENIDSHQRWNPYPLISLTIDLENSFQVLGIKSTFLQLKVEGYKYAEIAELNGIPLDTVKTNLRRTRKKLRLRLSA